MYLRGRRLNKKVFLCILFLVQILLIGIFIGFGSIYTEGSQTDTEYLVQFVKSQNIVHVDPAPSADLDEGGSKKIKVESTGANFFAEFFYVSAENVSSKVHCFRDGTMSEHRLSEWGTCECQLDYHGRDCGQPEVVWRAFMTAKMPLNATEPHRKARTIFYMIHATAINIETLEMQVQELVNVVDLFIFCNEQITYHRRYDGDESLSLRQHIKHAGVFKQHSSKILIVDNHKCTPKMVYHKFRRIVDGNQVRPTDIFLYSNADEILNWRAIKYFKWYGNWPQPVRFRLRYTVYGYFWQHPENTRLGSVAAQIGVLDELYKSDPERMALTKNVGMTIGDLNHAGGWFCQYCYHPMNIVRQLLNEGKDIFLEHKKAVVDSAYVERLISTGLYIDGKIGLTRLHKFADKYYAPDHITNASWKYESMLTNIYASYDDDYANE